MLNQIINYPHLKDVDMSSIESMGSLTSYLPPTLVVRFMVAVHNRIEFIESMTIDIPHRSLRSNLPLQVTVWLRL